MMHSLVNKELKIKSLLVFIQLIVRFLQRALSSSFQNSVLFLPQVFYIRSGRDRVKKSHILLPETFKMYKL